MSSNGVKATSLNALSDSLLVEAKGPTPFAEAGANTSSMTFWVFLSICWLKATKTSI